MPAARDLPAQPLVRCRRRRHINLVQIVAWAEGRASARVDDDITEADRTWVKDHHDGLALLRRVDSRRGLTVDDFAALTAWATGPG